MKVIKTILALILMFVLSLSLFTLCFSINVSNFFAVDEMEKTVEKIDVSHEISKIQNSSATSFNKAEILDIINSAYREAENHGISSKLVDEIFNSSEVKMFLGRIVGTTTDNVINDANIEPVTSDDFNKLLDDNIDKWISNSGVEISDSKKEVLVIRMKSAAAGVIRNLPTSDDINDKLSSEKKGYVQFIFSDKFRIGLVIISVLCFILLVIVKRKGRVWLLYGGSSLVISGLGLIVLSLIIDDMITFALKDYNVSFMINAFNDALSHSIMINGFVFVIISIFMFIIYGVYRKRVNQ